MVSKIEKAKYNRWYKWIREEEVPEYLKKERKEDKWNGREIQTRERDEGRTIYIGEKSRREGVRGAGGKNMGSRIGKIQGEQGAGYRMQ